MSVRLPEIDGMRIDDAAGVRGVGYADPLRLTRLSDGASVLLHEVPKQALARFHTGVFKPECTDFSRPFVTRFAGLLEFEDGIFLVEPLPPAVPLLSVWTAVLGRSPRRALHVLRSFAQQLSQIIDGLLEGGEIRDAICADNIVLTTSGRVYGLLQASLRLSQEWMVLRPSPDNLGKGQTAAEGNFDHHPKQATLVVRELGEIAFRSRVLTPTEKRIMESLCLAESFEQLESDVPTELTVSTECKNEFTPEF